jgi:CheY-like chemotaxis protein
MDGLSAARRIRDRELCTGRSRTPIIALTANVMSHQVASYRAAGMDDVVAKPIEIARLFEAIETCLAASSGPSAAETHFLANGSCGSSPAEASA